MNFLCRRTFLAAISAGSGLTACAMNPATGRHSLTGLVSIQKEISLGKQERPRVLEMFGGAYEDKKLARYLERIGQKLAAFTEYQDYPYAFTVLDTPIVNALALPGGEIFVTRGLMALANSEAELAGVLGHELGHVNARHSAERITRGQLASFGWTALSLLIKEDISSYQQVWEIGADLYLKSYSRKQEYEADKLAVRYIAKAGYDTEAMVSFLEALKAHSAFLSRKEGQSADIPLLTDIMSTHPRTVERVKAAMKESENLMPEAPFTHRDIYFDQIDGVVYGPAAKKAQITDGRLLDPEADVSFDMMSGYEPVEGQENFIAQNKEKMLFAYKKAAKGKAATPMAHLKNVWQKNANLRALETRRANGKDVAFGRVTESDGRTYLYAVTAHDKDAFLRFLLIAPNKNLAFAAEDNFEKAVLSLKALSMKERREMKPMRIDLHQVMAGDTIGKLAKDAPYGDDNIAFLRLLNGMEEDTILKVGDKIKLVRR